MGDSTWYTSATTYRPRGDGFDATGPFAGVFTGQLHESGDQWIHTFTFEINCRFRDITPGFFLQSLRPRLVGAASTWLQTATEVFALFKKGEMTTDEDVEHFQVLFKTKFSGRPYEFEYHWLNKVIYRFQQTERETIHDYYSRTLKLLRDLGGRDEVVARSSLPNVASNLDLLEQAVLDTVLYTFVRGLRDDAARKRTLGGLVNGDKSLGYAYQIALEATQELSDDKETTPNTTSNPFLNAWAPDRYSYMVFRPRGRPTDPQTAAGFYEGW